MSSEAPFHCTQARLQLVTRSFDDRAQRSVQLELAEITVHRMEGLASELNVSPRRDDVAGHLRDIQKRMGCSRVNE